MPWLPIGLLAEMSLWSCRQLGQRLKQQMDIAGPEDNHHPPACTLFCRPPPACPGSVDSSAGAESLFETRPVAGPETLPTTKGRPLLLRRAEELCKLALEAGPAQDTRLIRITLSEGDIRALAAAIPPTGQVVISSSPGHCSLMRSV